MGLRDGLLQADNRISAAVATIPSLIRKPVASSSSSPGVRMSTVNGSPSIRISSGASTARRSVSFAGAPERKRRTGAVTNPGAGVESEVPLTGRC